MFYWLAVCQIGTEYLRGVSGGEKKRCSIGMELITFPSLLFLDEPTTGLDANTANSIMELLQKYEISHMCLFVALLIPT